MTLAFSLDTAKFRELVDAALRKIPTASRGQWTLHAPVDPGITLVELFAWLLEQRSFWADQLSEPLVRGVMALYGDAIRTARAAGTAVTFAPELETDPARAFSPHARITRRTPLRIAETELVFTLHQGLFALALDRYPDAPAEPILHLSDPALEMDLRTGRPIEILAASGEAAQFELGIALLAATPASADVPVSILFELDTTVPPEWSPDAASAQPPATLVWEYKTTADTWVRLADVRDATLGLRRSGTLRFPLPADWSATAAGGDGKFVGWLRASTTAASYSAPPSVLAIVPNSGVAFHYQWRCQGAQPGWLPLPARTIQLEPGQLPLADHTVVLVAEADGVRRRWRVVPDFATSGPADRVCVVDRTRATISFGDGLTGKLPRLDPAAATQVSVVYEAGGGLAGNVAPCAWEPQSGPLAHARSYVPAVGGLDDETLDEARTRSASGLRTPTRAVTPEDHEKLATTTPGVAIARAHAEVGLALGECLVAPGMTTVFVVPEIHARDRDAVRAGTAIAAPICDPGALAEVRTRFARTRLLGELVVVANAAYRWARIRVRVTGAPHDREGARKRVSAAIRLFLDPLLGGTDGAGWPFGEPLRPTALLGVAQKELGDRGEVDEIAISLDGAPFEACEDVPLRAYELAAVASIDVAIATASSQEAGLR